MKTTIRYHCNLCGEENLAFYAMGKWDVETQTVQVQKADTRSAFCNDCKTDVVLFTSTEKVFGNSGPKTDFDPMTKTGNL